ncbi:CD99 antigen isoform X2 [Choloepus didactylus]|uniref:CD99 antigen isoform X2 n=1 Tax=Choloepus didactylus TaxID=27675 RepID=UPI0018A108C0|nr:CD99 antigen isoform X2 [Choloepus didactylus]
MARLAVLALLLVGLFCSLAPAQDEDFDLSDAIPDKDDKKPTHAPPKKPPSADDGFNLEDALTGGGKNDPAKPKPNPKPGSSDGFSDSDPSDRTSDGSDLTAMLSGITVPAVVAVLGAISSFIAYQKKKLCFKESNENDVNMENHPITKAKPLIP